jgi:hypothetical protein
MTRAAVPILSTLLFTVIVPGTVAVYVPMLLIGGFRRPTDGLLTWLGSILIMIGAAI